MNVNNTEFSTLNAGKQETRYFFVVIMRGSVKKHKKRFCSSVYVPDLFFCRYKSKRDILTTERKTKICQMPVSNIIIKTEMATKKYSIAIAKVIHSIQWKCCMGIMGFLGISTNTQYMCSPLATNRFCFSTWVGTKLQ